jgi:hypothetical protein
MLCFLPLKSYAMSGYLTECEQSGELECCGHLSAFEIGGVRYAVDAGMDDGWDMDEKSMRVCLDKVFSPGQTCLTFAAPRSS